MKKEYVADLSALCGAERFTFSEGKAKGIDAVRLYNGKLDLTVILDRCMDIFRLFYRGISVSYISKNGLVSPHLTGSEAYPFFSSFDAGFMYTCGLDNIGEPEIKDGRILPRHGSISYLPAENVRVETEEFNGEYGLSLKGCMKFTALFGQKLLLKREIRLWYLKDELEIRDEIINEGYTEEGYLLMYHTNIGYPVLDENAVLFVASKATHGISEIYDCSHFQTFESPSAGRAEEVYRHDLKSGKGAKAILKNKNFSLGFYFDAKDFPYMLEWKSMACGDYVLGLEPVTTPMPEKIFRILKPGQVDKYSLIWKFSEEV